MSDASHAVSLPAIAAAVHASCEYVSVICAQHEGRSSHAESVGVGSSASVEPSAVVPASLVDVGVGVGVLVLEDGVGFVLVVDFFGVGLAVSLLSSFVSRRTRPSTRSQRRRRAR